MAGESPCREASHNFSNDAICLLITALSCPGWPDFVDIPWNILKSGVLLWSGILGIHMDWLVEGKNKMSERGGRFSGETFSISLRLDSFFPG